MLHTVILRAAVRLALALGLLLWPALAFAHGGGTPRLTNEPAGPFRVYAWTEPEPWRAGEVHLSLAVTVPNENASNQPGAQVEVPVTDADIRVTYRPVEGEPIVVEATRQTTLGNFYFEADTVLPAPGLWQIEIAIDGQQGTGSTQFQLEALPPRTINWTLVASAGGVLLILIALIGVWSRIQQPTPAAHKPRPGARRHTQTGQSMRMGEE
jgi:hypothetical protein